MLIKFLRRTGVYLGHLVVALIGTAILSIPILHIARPHSVAGILWKELIVSVIGAGLIGFGMYRTWKSKTGAWIWILPTAWFALHAFSVLSLTRGQSMFSQTSGMWPQIFGFDCVDRTAVTYCRDFFDFTVPFVRSIAYSVGALVGIYFATPLTSPIRDAKVVM